MNEKFRSKLNNLLNTRNIKRNLVQISALVEKNVKLQLRFKLPVFISFIMPIIGIMMPMIILGQFFESNIQFGPWNQENFLVFQFIAYNLSLLSGIINQFPTQFSREKYWQTLPALIIGSFNRFNLLFGIFLGKLILISIPFIIFLLICFFYYPISFITFIFVILLYFLIALVFSGVGLILGIFAISKEGYLGIINFILKMVILLSTISYPFELFPEPIQVVINMNPLYYIFSILRLTWIQNNLVITFSENLYNFLILLTSAISIPAIGVFIFNKIYKKYGIVGY